MYKQFILISLSTIVAINVVVVQSNQNNTKSYGTCIACLSEVLQMEEELMQNLQRYREEISDRLTLIRFVVEILRKNHKDSEQNTEKYLSNPLNAFALIRRMYSDWLKWQDFMKEAISKRRIDLMNGLRSKMPTSNDLKEVQAGIVRIQITYQLNAKEISKGFFKGKYFGSQFSTHDCYSMGNYLYKQKNYESALNWFNASLELYTDGNAKLSDFLGVVKSDIWFLISKSQTLLGRSLLNLDLFEKAVDSFKMVQRLKNNNWSIYDQEEDLKIYMEYLKLCRGVYPSKLKSKLHCRYNSTTTPFLKLAPFKVEEISKDPYIVIYHDVIYESEIEELKRVALSRLQRGLVDWGSTSSGRTVQVAKINVNATALIDRIDERTNDITGLDFSDTSTWDVVNYGIGGFYGSHHDYYDFTKDTDKLGRGNRIASIVYYLSDVGIGGVTSFDGIKTIVQPKKGSAFVVYTLDNTGEGNFKTLHSSCPVILGSKWILIKLAYYRHQMFRMPCHKM